jgi:hypothetical protein
MPARRWTLVIAAVSVVALPLGLASRAQERVAKEDQQDRKLVDRWKREAAEYRIVAETEPETVLTLKPEPALRWTNPVRDTDDGLVFLWLARGKPAAVACFYRVRFEGRPTEAHEFHSLARVGLSASLEGRTFWSPTVAGVAPKPVPGAPRPAATAAERLRQMRGMAREFRAYVDVDKGRTALRQLSHPVFRQEPGADGSQDWALFGYVLTTDPEALLVLEERSGSDGPAWHYGFARMSNHSLSAKHNDRLVWEAAAEPNNGDPAKPYFVRWDVRPQP